MINDYKSNDFISIQGGCNYSDMHAYPINEK